jgi:hypothetical protein
MYSEWNKGYKHKMWEKPAIVDFLIVDYCKISKDRERKKRV